MRCMSLGGKGLELEHRGSLVCRMKQSKVIAWGPLKPREILVDVSSDFCASSCVTFAA